MKADLVKRLIRDVRIRGTHEEGVWVESATGSHFFDVYRVGEDCFLFQRLRPRSRGGAGNGYGLAVVIQLRDLGVGRKGFLMILSSGSFSTILTPLFSGVLGRRFLYLPKGRRSAVLAHRVVLGRLVQGHLELLQRDVAFECLRAADAWLHSIGLGLDEVVFGERTPEAVAYAEQLGQAWRVCPQVFTPEEIQHRVFQARQPMETAVYYFTSLRGIHWLTYEAFMRVAALARRLPAAARVCLREWLALAPGETASAMRSQKCGGYAVISFFGVSREVAEHLLIPPLERLLEGITLGLTAPEDMADVLEGVGLLFQRALREPAFAEDRAPATVSALYAKLMDDREAIEVAVDFDARRIALPGVTVLPDGRLEAHPGIDGQTRQVVEHLVRRLSLGEHLQFINVYEVRSTKNLALRSGQSREIVLKTDRSPVPRSYVQKRLGSVNAGYSDYLLTRANVFRALGADYPDFQLITVEAHGQKRKETPYFLRTRCPGDPLMAIAPSLFRADPENPAGAELPEVVLALASLYGTAAAQNLVVKKYVPMPTPTCRFGIGKEIFAFVYDPFMHRPMPEGVQVCSIRGTMGWPILEQQEDNLREAHKFYLRTYAAVAGTYWHAHAEACTLNECAAAFFDGFERKIEAMHWAYRQNRTNFDLFDPHLRAVYNFRGKLDFALWALERAAADLPALREHFMDYVRDAFIRV